MALLTYAPAVMLACAVILNGRKDFPPFPTASPLLSEKPSVRKYALEKQGGKYVNMLISTSIYKKRKHILAWLLIAALLVLTPSGWLALTAEAEGESAQVLPADCLSMEETSEGGKRLLGVKDKTVLAGSTYTKVVVPHDVTEIANDAFYDAPYIQEVDIPYGVTQIGSNAFRDCTSLQRVIIPGSVIRIYDNAFSNCTALEEVTLLYGVQQIGEKAFAGCPNLQTVTAAPSINYVMENLFDQSNEQLTVYTLEEGAMAAEIARAGITRGELEKNPDSEVLFKYEANSSGVTLTGYHYMDKETIHIPSSIGGQDVIAIGDEAFANRPSLKNVTIPNSTVNFGTDVFQGSGGGSKVNVWGYPGSSTETYAKPGNTNNVEFKDLNELVPHDITLETGAEDWISFSVTPAQAGTETETVAETGTDAAAAVQATMDDTVTVTFRKLEDATHLLDRVKVMQKGTDGNFADTDKSESIYVTIAKAQPNIQLEELRVTFKMPPAEVKIAVETNRKADPAAFPPLPAADEQDGWPADPV